MQIRRYIPADISAVAELFYTTVHVVNTKDYTSAELDAWAPGIPDLEVWNRSLLEHDTLVAIIDGIIVGFADMDGTGYLDRLYVHHAYQSRGIATALCDRLEEHVSAERFVTHASITAKRFFEKRGYCVVKEQQVERYGIMLKNYVMEKENRIDR